MLKITFYLLFLLVIGCSGIPSDRNSSYNSAGTECDLILENCKQKISSIDFNKQNSEASLIVYSMLYSKQEVSEKLKILVNNEYNPIPYLLYLSSKLYECDEPHGLLPFLQTFYEKDSDNAIPCYLLSYYYASTLDYSLSYKFLKEGNSRDKFDYYSQQIKNIMYDFVMKNTNSEICALSSQFSIFDNDLMMVLRRLSRKLSGDVGGADICNEIVKMGSKIEMQSKSLIGKLFGITIQFDGLGKDIDSEQISRLKEKRRHLLSLKDNLSGKSGKEELLRYLIIAFENGEVYALQKLKEDYAP